MSTCSALPSKGKPFGPGRSRMARKACGSLCAGMVFMIASLRPACEMARLFTMPASSGREIEAGHARACGSRGLLQAYPDAGNDAQKRSCNWYNSFRFFK
jgi:hypothetical protein